MILEYVNVALSAVSALGLGYLLVSGKYVIGYPAFFRRVLLGLLLYAVTGVIALSFQITGIHLVHALSAFFVAAGCYSLLEVSFEQSDDFGALEP